MILKLDQFEVEFLKILSSNKSKNSMFFRTPEKPLTSKVAETFKNFQPSPIHNEDNDNHSLAGDEESSRPQKRRKKGPRLRSRNEYIDVMLQEEWDDDDYADLEDWIVNEREDPRENKQRYSKFVNTDIE